MRQPHHLGECEGRRGPGAAACCSDSRFTPGEPAECRGSPRRGHRGLGALPSAPPALDHGRATCGSRCVRVRVCVCTFVSEGAGEGQGNSGGRLEEACLKPLILFLPDSCGWSQAPTPCSASTCPIFSCPPFSTRLLNQTLSPAVCCTAFP